MAQSSAATLISACPKCGTRYQLAREAIAGGRVVQCAHCQTVWQPDAGDTQPAPSEDEADRLFEATEEARMDEAISAMDRRIAAEAAVAEATAKFAADSRRTPAEPSQPSAEKTPPDVNPAVPTKLLRLFTRRQDRLRRQLPIGRLRRTARIGAFTALAALLAGGYVLRAEVVQVAPDLAGLYGAVGLPVNVVGLEFRDVRTLATLSDGVPMLQIHARIASVSTRGVVVPPVLVTLLGDEGSLLYEWRVRPAANDLEPGEAFDFETTLTQFPAGADRVRLTFTQGTPATEAAGVALPIQPETH